MVITGSKLHVCSRIQKVRLPAFKVKSFPYLEDEMLKP